MGVIYLADIPFYYDNQYSISSQVVGDFKFFTGDINSTANVIGEFTFFSGDINGSANKIGDFTFFSGDINGSVIELGGVLTGLEEERTNFINNVIVSSGVSPLTDISTVPITIPELGNSNDLQENTLQGTSADDEVKVELDILKQENVKVNALSGNDVISAYAIGKNEIIHVDGGDGDDTLYASFFKSQNNSDWDAENSYVIFNGGLGRDDVIIFVDVIPDIKVNTLPQEGLRELNFGDNLNATIAADTESITFHASAVNNATYLTEDLFSDRIRSVDFSERYARTYNENADWYVKGLDTFTEYHSIAPTPEPTPAPIPTPTPEPTSAPIPATTPQPSADDPIIGTAGKDKLKAKGRSIEIYGMGGNDKIIGSNGDDILDGGFGNDKINGKKGADIYILSPGKDKFQGFKIKEGDTIQIDSSIDFEVSGSSKLSKIEHDMGVTTIKKVAPNDLESVIDVV